MNRFSLNFIVLAIGVMVAAKTCHAAVRIEDEFMGKLVQSAIDAPGRLDCTAGEAMYEVPEQELFNLVFLDPSVNRGAWIERVQMGPSNAALPECQSRKIDTVYKLATLFSDCGFTASTSLSTQETTFGNQAKIVIRLPAPPGLIKRKTFIVPLNCVGSGISTVVVPTVWLNTEFVTGDMTSNYSVPTIVKLTKHLRDDFNEPDIIVNVLTVELAAEHVNLYDILGNQIIISTTANRSVEPSQALVASRGCIREDSKEFVRIIKVNSHKIIYETPDFLMSEETDDYFFHVEMNVCSRATPQARQYCEDLCFGNRALLRNTSPNQANYATSIQKIDRANTRFAIKNGVLSRIPRQ